MTRRGIFSAALSTLAFGALFSVNLPAQSQEAYVLRRVFKTGATGKYKTTFNIDSAKPMQSFKIEMQMETTELVKEVKPDGSAIVETMFDAAKVALNGSEMPLPNMPRKPFVTEYDKDGRVSKRELGAGTQGNISQMLSMTRMEIVPDRALKIGEEWKLEITGDGDKEQKLSGSILLMGKEKVEGFAGETLKVKYRGDAMVPSVRGDQKVHIEAMAYLDVETRQPVKIEGTVSGANLGPAGDAKIKFKHARVPAADKS